MTSAISNQTTYQTAIPYALSTLAVGVVGAGVALFAAATALKVIGVAAALFGAYAFGGVLFCAIRYSHNPNEFRDNVYNYISASFGFAIWTVIDQIVRSVIQSLIDSALGRR